MNSNDTRYKIFQKSKTDGFDYRKSKNKDPNWKKDQRQQNKRNWQEQG